MQVTINVDSSTIGGTVEAVFKSLSDADKKDLARQLMLEVLTKPNDAERIAFEAHVVDSLIAAKSSSTYDRIDTPKKARESYEYRDRMSKFQSSREVMVKTITTEAIKQYRESVAELVANDENLKTIYEEVKATIIENYPSMVQTAMTHYLAGQMNNIGTAIQNNINTSTNVGMALADITRKLSSHGINLHQG